MAEQKKKSKGGFMERRQAQLETEHEKAMRQAMEEATGRLAGPDPEEMPGSLPGRDLATAYYEKTSSWMHRFSDVRSDNMGFYLLHEDNPDAWRMKPGDLIQDVAVNAQPYWEVEENDRFETKRVSLRPIGPNPFVTGVGAGGAKIYSQDIKVLTGEYEQDRVDAIARLIESNEYKDINDVSYILLGTVAVNFGPNGPQGGWYNADDRSSRGSRRGMNPIDIVKADARTLKDLGFAISSMALNGEIDSYEWTKFICNPPAFFTDWRDTPPYDTEIYSRRMTEYYGSQGLLDDEWRRNNLLEEVNLWDQVIDLWDKSDGLTYEEIRGHGYKLEHKLMGVWKFLVFSTPDEDPLNIENAILMLNHRQSDIQARAVSRCIMHMHSADDESVEAVYQAIRRFIKSGHGYWLVNEQIIRDAEVRGDAELLIEAAHLPDGTNRKYAYWGLINLRHPYVKEAVYVEDDPEALSAIASALCKHLFLPGRAETYFMLERLTDMMSADRGTFNRAMARDGLICSVRLAWKQDLDTEAAEKALKDFEEEGKRRNPGDDLHDLEWVETVVSRMKEVVEGSSSQAIAANPDDKPKNPIRDLLYGGLPSGGGYECSTYMELAAQHIAEAAHCILGSLGKAHPRRGREDWRKSLGYEVAHLREEIGIIVDRVFKFERFGWERGAYRRMNDPEGDYYKYVTSTVANIREASPILRKIAGQRKADLEVQDDVPHPIRVVGLLCYDVVIALTHAMESVVKNWPQERIYNPFIDIDLRGSVALLDEAVAELLKYPW